MEVRIGLGDAMRELEVELEESVPQEAVTESLEKARAEGGLWWLTDRRGKRIGVPVAKLLFVEISPDKEQRKVGFRV
jgi:hypothetical protein